MTLIADTDVPNKINVDLLILVETLFILERLSLIFINPVADILEVEDVVYQAYILLAFNDDTYIETCG